MLHDGRKRIKGKKEAGEVIRPKQVQILLSVPPLSLLHTNVKL